MNIIIYIETLVVLAIMDVAWLLSMGGFYKAKLGHLFADTVNFIPAVLFYLLYGVGLMFFVILPALRAEHSLWWTLGMGALFGLIAYATYDLTNHATMKNWPAIITLIDLAWGALLTGLTCMIVVGVTRYFK